MSRPSGAVIAAALCFALFGAAWLAGRQERLRVVLVAAKGTDTLWLAAVSAGLRGAYGERVAVEAARWQMEIADLPHREAGVGPQYDVASVLGRVPAIPGNPLIAVVCDADLGLGGDPSTTWVHGTGIPAGRLILSVRRISAEHPAPQDSVPRVALLAAHEFGHVLGYGHRRDDSLMAFTRPGLDLLRLTPRFDRADAIELPLRCFVRGRIAPGSPWPLPLIAVCLLALPACGCVCLVWHGLRRRFGSARVLRADLVLGVVFAIVGVMVRSYGWAFALAALALLHGPAARLIPRDRGLRLTLATYGVGLGLGLLGCLADLGYLLPAARIDPGEFDPAALAAFPGALLAAQVLRAVRGEPLEGLADWGNGWPPRHAALAWAAIAALLSSPSVVLGAGVAAFAALRLCAVRALRIDLPHRAAAR